MSSQHFDEQKLREISERVDLVELVAESVRLTRKGGRYWGICPFHQEKTPSFSVNREKNVFYCFGCHKGGNVFAFLMQKDGLSFREAALVLAQRAGVELAVAEEDRQRSDQRRELLAMNKMAAGIYHQQLIGSGGNEARIYLDKRGISAESIEQFELGLAGNDGDALVHHLQKKGYSIDSIKANGLARSYEQSHKVYDLFRERIIFPIARYDSGVIAFGGRTMGDTVPKYLNSPESELFSKRRNLYGLLQAREHMRRLNQAVLVEGYMDCIKLHQAGVKNAVASLGTAFTAEQAELIARYAESVVVVYDGDEAGQRETIRALDILENHSLVCYVLVLPPGKDPDELVTSMRGAGVAQYIENNRITGLEYRIMRLVETTKGDGIEEKLRIIREIKPRIQCLESSLEKDFYSRLLAQKLRIEEDVVTREMRARRTNISRQAAADSPAEYSPDLAERLVAAVINKPYMYERLVQALGSNILAGTVQGEILQVYSRLQAGKIEALECQQAMEAELSKMGYAGEYARIMVLTEEQYLSEAELNELIVRLRIKREEKAWNALAKRVNMLGDTGEFEDFLKIILDFHRILKYSREGEAY